MSKLKMLGILSAVFLMVLASFASAGWTSKNQYDPWDANRQIKLVSMRDYPVREQLALGTSIKAGLVKRNTEWAKTYVDSKRPYFRGFRHDAVFIDEDGARVMIGRIENLGRAGIIEGNIRLIRGMLSHIPWTGRRTPFQQYIPANDPLFAMHENDVVEFKLVGGNAATGIDRTSDVAEGKYRYAYIVGYANPSNY